MFYDRNRFHSRSRGNRPSQTSKDSERLGGLFPLVPIFCMTDPWNAQFPVKHYFIKRLISAHKVFVLQKNIKHIIFTNTFRLLMCTHIKVYNYKIFHNNLSLYLLCFNFLGKHKITTFEVTHASRKSRTFKDSNLRKPLLVVEE